MAVQQSQTSVYYTVAAAPAPAPASKDGLICHCMGPGHHLTKCLGQLEGHNGEATDAACVSRAREPGPEHLRMHLENVICHIHKQLTSKFDQVPMYKCDQWCYIDVC